MSETDVENTNGGESADCLTRFVGKDTYGRPRNEKVRSFLLDVLAVCKRHGLSISHEDFHGGFEVEKWSDQNAEWFGAAADRTD